MPAEGQNRHGATRSGGGRMGWEGMFGQSGHLSRLCFLDDHDPDLADHDADPGDHDRPDPRDQNRPIRLLTIGRGSDSRTSTVSSWCLLWHRLLGRPAS